MKRLLTVQDLSCLGKCSLTVALPVISALGVECAILPTAVLSTHTGGFGKPAVLDLSPGLESIPAHWQSQGVTFDGLYFGYLGSVHHIDAAKRILRELRAPGAPAILDPVLGDHGLLYSGFDDAYVAAMRDLVAEADLVLPNLTEAAFLTGAAYREDLTYAERWALLDRMASLSGGSVVLTGVTDAEKPDQIGAAFYDAATGKRGAIFARKLEQSYHGTGDLFASVVAALLTWGEALERAVGIAVEFTAECIAATMEAGTEERYGVAFEQKLGLLTNL